MNHECKECTFVNSAEDIYISSDVLKKVTGKPLFVGIFTLPKWVGHSRFYAFKCPRCGAITVDYPHGYTDGGRLYFLLRDHFSDCTVGGEGEVLPINDIKIYKAEEVEASKGQVRSIQTWLTWLSASPVVRALIALSLFAALLFYMTRC